MKRSKVTFTSHSVSVAPEDNYKIFCQHGPCLLFERRKKRASEVERFYACSVYRNRKFCNFYLPENSSKKISKENSVSCINSECTLTPDKRLYDKLKKIRKLSYEKRFFCVTCQVLSDDEETSQHNGHKLQWGITNVQLRNPTKLISALTDKDKEAQYWFSKSSLSFLVETIDRFNFDGVLCVGTPRLFEALNGSSYKKKIKSFLLDYDTRFAQFWSPRFYAQFNMNADFFHNPSGKKHLDNFFVSSTRLLLVVDPPFGALCCQIAKTVQSLAERFSSCKKLDAEHRNSDVHSLWIAPYFLEKKICENWPAMSMVDYRIDYENHPMYKKSRTSQRSPIRIFTTLPQNAFVLPPDNYRFCKKCNRYTSKVNRHCDLCSTCPSKDGKPYVHCKFCKKCVKESYSHCKECGRCHLAGRCLPVTTNKRVAAKELATAGPEKKRAKKKET